MKIERKKYQNIGGGNQIPNRVLSFFRWITQSCTLTKHVYLLLLNKNIIYIISIDNFINKLILIILWIFFFWMIILWRLILYISEY